jgi:ankyrin repeat protein
MVESLVKQDPHLLDVDIAHGWGSPLIYAIAKNPDYLSILLKLGVDSNKLSSFDPRSYGSYLTNDNSYTPISWATAIGREDIVDFLLSRTRVDIPNDILYKAVAAWKPSPELIHKFRQRGADINFIVNGDTIIHIFLSLHLNLSFYDKSQFLPVVKVLAEPSCDLSLQDRTARTALHIALDGRLEDVVAYLLERNAGLSATATLLPDMWSWAIDRTWFPKVQAAALAADQPCTRIKGKVVDDTTRSRLVEFSVVVTADRDNPNPISAVVVSLILDHQLLSSRIHVSVDLSCCNQSLHKDIQDSPQDDSPRLECSFEWERGQYVSCCLFNYHQEDKVIKMLQQLAEDKDSTGTSLFLQMPKNVLHSEASECVAEFVLDIYRGPLP